jgi:hypothetical protein
MEYVIDVELSERELISIGKIVALWGLLEYEIFCQTLKSFSGTPANQLPREMNNMQFSQVLALWKTRLVDKASGKLGEVLQDQHKKIDNYYEFRNALVHGMWDWSRDTPERITATRIRKREIVRAHFTADDLLSFASDLESINFKLRHPGGAEEYAAAMAEQGAHVSRRGFSVITNNPLVDDLFSPYLHKRRKIEAE